MFYCVAYNLAIKSDFPLPELAPATQGGDVIIRLLPEQPAHTARAIWWEPALRRARFDFPGAGRFVVANGKQIFVMPEPPADLPLLRLYIQGMILAALLDQRGFLVLHASVIQINNRAIAFVGPVGAGKSTVAAALHARGHSVLSDDNAAIDWQSDFPSVMPAFPNLKVYPEIARTLGYDPAGLRVMHESQTKQAQRVETRFAAAPAPLDRIYLLDRQGPSRPARLQPLETVTEMVRHSVPTRWAVTGDAGHLAKCARIASRVPMFRTRTFSRLDEIGELASRIEEHSAESPREAYANHG